MHPKIAILSVFAITCHGLSIEKVTDNYKSVTITGNAFEDKHDSDDFGKHLAIATKKKVKKRLASPLNYKVSAFDESDDYYEKGGGDSDNNSDGNYENKDWSDLNREPINIKNPKSVLKNLDLTNIEGIDVIKKQSEDFQSPKNVVKNEVIPKSFDGEEEDEKQDGNPLIAIHTTDKVSSKKPINSDELNDYYDIHKTDEKVIHNTEKSIQDKLKKPKDNQDIGYYDEPSKQDENSYTTSRKAATTTEKIHAKRRKTKTNYAMNDYYDTADKIRSDAEQGKEDRENEVKKIKILDAIDDLKERHAHESKLISERFKEEELQREEFERNNPRSYPRNSDKYRESSQHKPRGRVMSDYEEYEERPNFRDKYKPEPVSERFTTTKSTTTAVSTGKPQGEYRKMSIFKSPQLYLSYDDADETTEQTTRKVARPITAAESSNERISLIPEDAKEGEPTLFMPKKFYKNKKQKKPNNIPEEYTPQTKYSPNKNIRATTLAMVTDHFFPTTDISFTMPTEPLYSTELSTEYKKQELRPKPTEYKYTGTEVLQPHRTTESDYYTDKTIGDSDFTEKATGDNDFTEKATGDNDFTEKTIRDIDYTEKIMGDNDYTEKANGDSDSTDKNVGDSDYNEKKAGDNEVDMSGVGSDLNSITTNENFDENSTETYEKVDAKYPDIEPEISLARIEETTEFSSDGSEDLTKPTIIIQVRDDVAPESSDRQSEDYRNGKESSGRRHESEQDQQHREQGRKHYENENEQEIIGKGFHNVKKDIDKYDSHEQVKENYGDDSAHSASHDHRESGKKHAEYEETGKHSKGHSTKGSHDVHKKEEYEKKEEFFDYSGEEDDKAKKNRVVKSYDQSGVMRQVAGNPKPRRAYAIRDAGVQAPIKKPTIRNTTREKWIHHHGYPARTNNLHLIDRRRDLNTHWPYFG